MAAPRPIGPRADLAIEWPPEYYQYIEALTMLPAWFPKVAEIFMPALGYQGVTVMRRVMRPNRYKGTLERSVQAQYVASEMTVYIGPTAQRGNYDAGVLLEQGTRPIPGVPWLPIKRWSAFRGIPAWPVWKKIRERGVSPHPFVDATHAEMHTKNQKTLRLVSDQLAIMIIEHTQKG